MIKLHGIYRSRAFRPLWLLEELEVPFEQVPVDFRQGETHHPDFLALNPNAHVPVLEDDGFVLWESMAINFYLAEKFGGPIWPDSARERGLCHQWTFWVMTEVEKPLLNLLWHAALLPEEKRDPEKVRANTETLQGPFAVLNAALADRAYLLGDNFTLADLNVAAVFSWARAARMEMAPYPHLSAWLKNCLSRPARKKAALRA